MKIRVLDLFSGIGGFSLGLERTGGFETVAFCEIDPFCRRVLAKHWPEVPIYEDVRSMDATGLGGIDCITGGYPCQPYSHAGKQRGAEDDRHLWPAMLAVVQAARPRWVIGENVAGHISLGLDDVLSDLEARGYTARVFVIPACAVGAPHRRDRVWVVAHDDGIERGADEGKPDTEADRGHNPSWIRANVPDAALIGPSRQGGAVVSLRQETSDDWKVNRTVDDTGWPVEPNVGRVAHGIPNRVDRLRGLGNAVVPQIPEMIGRAILEAEAA